MGMGVLDEHADDIVVSPSQLRTAWLELEQQMAVFALAVAHVDGTGAWGDDGSVSMLAWMRDRLRMSNSDAHAWLRRANLLNHYDAFAECAGVAPARPSAQNSSSAPLVIAVTECCAQRKIW